MLDEEDRLSAILEVMTRLEVLAMSASPGTEVFRQLYRKLWEEAVVICGELLVKYSSVNGASCEN